MTALTKIYAGGRITASAVQGIAPLGAIKTADQTVTSSTTLVNDAALFASLLANSGYLFWCMLDYEGGTQGSSDLKWAWTVPSGSTMRYDTVYTGNGGGSNISTLLTEAATTAAGTNGSGNTRGLTMTGTILTSSTAGTLQLQWAQNTSNGTGTIVHAQSFLALWQMQ